MFECACRCLYVFWLVWAVRGPVPCQAITVDIRIQLRHHRALQLQHHLMDHLLNNINNRLNNMQLLHKAMQHQHKVTEHLRRATQLHSAHHPPILHHHRTNRDQDRLQDFQHFHLPVLVTAVIRIQLLHQPMQLPHHPIRHHSIQLPQQAMLHHLKATLHQHQATQHNYQVLLDWINVSRASETLSRDDCCVMLYKQIGA